MPPLSGTEWCWAHSPDVAVDRSKARRRGGKATKYPQGAKRERVSFETVKDIRAELELVYQDTLLQDNSPQRSRTLGFLIGIGLQVLNVGAFEERLAALEAQNHTGPRRVA